MSQNPYFPVNNDLGAIITLTAASANATSAQLSSAGARGVRVVVDITAITGSSPTLTVTIKNYDRASNSYYTVLASAALTATGFTELTVYPGATVTANVSANDHLAQLWEVTAAIGGTTPAVTATIGACLLV
jgi:hypothetical protein